MQPVPGAIACLNRVDLHSSIYGMLISSAAEDGQLHVS